MQSTTPHPYSESMTPSQFGAAMAAFVSSGYQFPSVFTSAPASVRGPTWALYPVSASSDTASWVNSGSSVFTSDTAPPFQDWSPSVNPYSAHPAADDGEPEIFPFEPGTPMLSEPDSQTPSWPSAYMDSEVHFTAQPFGSSFAKRNLAPIKTGQDSSSSSTIGRTPPLERKKPTARAKKPTARRERVETLKRKAGADSVYPGDLPSAALPGQAEETLLAQFGQYMTAPESGPLTAEHVRREAWRICQAEAHEMKERRMRLIEHEGGALERETARMQRSVATMRESIEREQRDLERAVAMAERLSTST